MLHDSMDVGVLAENVRLLQKEIEKAGSELPTPEAGDAGKVLTVNNDLGYSIAVVPHEVPTPGEGDTGKIIKVGSSGYELATEYSYTPPAYSKTSEVNTGRKWINGKDIYEKVYEGTFGSTSSAINLGSIEAETLIDIRAISNGSDIYATVWNGLTAGVNLSTNTVNVAPLNSSFYEKPVFAIVQYTKPTPAPTPGNETKKKTSKKGE